MEKIRVSLSSPQRTQLTYTHKLYSFQTENVAIEPVNIQEICEQADFNSQNANDAAGGAAAATPTPAENDKNQSELVFDHEWTHQKVIIACARLCAIFNCNPIQLFDFYC